MPAFAMQIFEIAWSVFRGAIALRVSSSSRLSVWTIDAFAGLDGLFVAFWIMNCSDDGGVRMS